MRTMSKREMPVGSSVGQKRLRPIEDLLISVASGIEQHYRAAGLDGLAPQLIGPLGVTHEMFHRRCLANRLVDH